VVSPYFSPFIFRQPHGISEKSWRKMKGGKWGHMTGVSKRLD
jgi:hypothetical protein